MAITPGTSSSAIAQPLAPYTRALPGLYGPGDPTVSATVVHQQRPILAPFFVNNGLPEIVGLARTPGASLESLRNYI